METRLGRFAGIALTTALILEGCAPSDAQSSPKTQEPQPQPSSAEPAREVVLLLDCQVNPMDHNRVSYFLGPDQTEPFGAITEEGEINIFDLKNTTQKGLEFIFENDFNNETTGVNEYRNNNFHIKIEAGVQDGITTVGLTLECIDFYKQQQLPQT